MGEEQGAVELTDLPPRLPKSGPPHVLLVDDDPDFLEFTSYALVEEGMNVSCARTPGEALIQAVKDPPDVILLDILLGGADGLDVLEALRAEPETRGVPVLACTALGQRDSGKLLPTLGFDGLLAKPLDARTLARALRAHVRRRTEG
jgi:DNA-binding response OmpR family regulator